MAVNGEPKDVIPSNWPESSRLSSAGQERPNKASDHQVDNISTEDQKPISDAGREGWLLRLWKHVKRRWLYYTIGLIILIAILLPVL